MGLVTPLKLILMVPQPNSALASSIEALRVHTPPAVAQTPLPGTASPASPLLLTVSAVEQFGVGVGLGDGEGDGEGVGVGLGALQPLQFNLMPPWSPLHPSTAIR